MVHTEVVICIPTVRPPPIATLANHDVGLHEVLILADPRVYKQHREYYRGDGPWTVIEGAVGMVPQVAECYKQAHYRGYHWYFRADDDLDAKAFTDLTQRKIYLPLTVAIEEAFRCAHHVRTNLAGFVKGTNTWGRKIKRGEYKSTYGLIHGGAHVCCAARDPSRYIDLELRHFEDVYRSLAHREECGAVGRVAWIGMDLSKSVGGAASTITKNDKTNAREIAIIIKRFPGMVSFKDGFARAHKTPRFPQQGELL